MNKLTIGVAALVFMLLGPAYAHRSGCHRWHSCPSDTGSYTCGDLGYTTYCPTPEQPATVSIPAAAPPVSGALRTTTANLNLRAGPSADTAKVATLASGTKVALLSCGSGWCRVSTKGRIGYVSQKYLR